MPTSSTPAARLGDLALAQGLQPLVPHAGIDQPGQDQPLVNAQAQFPVRACVGAAA